MSNIAVKKTKKLLIKPNDIYSIEEYRAFLKVIESDFEKIDINEIDQIISK